jgi:hypothetical protein
VTTTRPAPFLAAGSSWVPRSPLGLWCLATLAGALVLTVAETVLLERKFGFIRGGYLASYQLESPAQHVVFLVALLLTNAAVIGVGAAIWLLVARWGRLAVPAAVWVTAVLAAGPVLAATIASYEIFRYLGDIDLSVMFGLAGRSVGELLAVSSAHLLRPAGVLAISIAATLVVTWWLHRRGGGRARAVSYSRSVPVTAVLVALTGTGVHVGARLWDANLDFGLARAAAGGSIGRLVYRVTDFDRDGFGLLQRPSDPDPWNAAIYPWALEIPGNGIDENGVGGDLPAGFVPYSEPSGTAPAFAWKPDVVLVLLESVRADAVGAALNGRQVTPVLDSLAAAGGASQAAYSHNGYTTQSRYHLFSGSMEGLRGPDSLIDDFKRNGYEVVYISGQDDTFGGSRLQVGAHRADVFFHAPHAPERRFTRFSTPGSLALPLSEIEARIADAVERRDRARPLFLYVNFADTHFPYHHAAMRPLVDDTVVPQGRLTAANADPLRRMYLNTVANVDAAIGRVLQVVEGSSDRPLGVMVTSDHGESLFDDGVLGHGFELTELQTRVPFVVSGLPLVLDEPFGQAEVRDALWAALAAPAHDTRPQFRPSREREVAQYIGSLSRPAQFGLLRQDGRIVVDFMNRRARFDPHRRWADLNELTPGERALADHVVHTWERIRLATAAGREGSSSTTESYRPASPRQPRRSRAVGRRLAQGAPPA